MENFLEVNPESILIDPDLFENFFSVIKKRVPVFIQDSKLYVFTRNEDQTKDLNIIKKEIDLDLLNEKFYLIKNYKKWKDTRIFNKDAPIRAILDFLLTESILNNISDIHFNIINETEGSIKVKKNTMLFDYCVLSKSQFECLLLCFKVLSLMDTSKKLLPQTSSFFKIFRGEVVDFRVSTHPTFLGERFVIRVLEKKNVNNFRKMNLPENIIEIVEKVIDYPNGLILFTGPTNSGKTTLIHSIISEISKKNLTIMTLEDPVEYRVPGIIQTNVSENGLSFFEGMKSILRQDPDVIFLGEIRDSDTAKIAVQAALTGHKVLSTLHAYSTKGAVTRLLDMGVSNILLAESLISVFSQRLLRSSCDDQLVLLIDALFFNEEMKDLIRKNDLSFIKDDLKNNAKKLLLSGLIDEFEIKRVLG